MISGSIGIVPQDCVLFNDSFAYNIGYGIKSRQLTDASMDDIVAAVSCFINNGGASCVYRWGTGESGFYS